MFALMTVYMLEGHTRVFEDGVLVPDQYLHRTMLKQQPKQSSSQQLLHYNYSHENSDIITGCAKSSVAYGISKVRQNDHERRLSPCAYG